MATINLGNLTFTHKGDYAGGTAYVKNDVVYYATNGNSYIAKTSTTGNAPTSTSHWDLFVAGSSGIWNAGLSLGSAGQSVKVNSAGNALEFGTISSGTYSVHRIDQYYYRTSTSNGASTDYLDIAGGNTVNFTPTSTNDKVHFNHWSSVNFSDGNGCDVYLNMGTSSSLGSGNTKLNYTRNHTTYVSGASDMYFTPHKTFVLPCTNLTVGTTYYVEQAGAVHSGGTTTFNTADSNSSWQYVTGSNGSAVTMIHYKYN